jgi:glycosyltransferase involved in cell wall biosynthesis
VFFQNPDDERYFVRSGMVSGRQRRVRINGSGVDLARFAAAPLPDGPVTFLLIARLIREKGIIEYVEAARLVKARHPGVRVQLLGSLDSNPTAIAAAEVDSWHKAGLIEYLGAVEDVRPILRQAHVSVLPSFYGEGVPRSLIEALSMGRAIVTTDMPGCRETVDRGRNGILVPPRDVGALADAMIRLVESPHELKAMAMAGRAVAEERFDVREVNRVILEAMGLRASSMRIPAPGRTTASKTSFGRNHATDR